MGERIIPNVPNNKTLCADNCDTLIAKLSIIAILCLDKFDCFFEMLLCVTLDFVNSNFTGFFTKAFKTLKTKMVVITETKRK